MQNNESYGYIYKVTNILTGKSYIGQTIGSIEKRWYNHCRDNRSNSVIHKAINKYGKESFQVDLLDTGFDKFDLDNLEIHYIKSLNTMSPSGYNIRTGGARGKFSEESRKKMSESQKGKKRSEESIKKGVEGRRGKTSPWLGKKHTKEHRKNVSEALTGLPKTSLRKPIVDSSGIIYESVTAAAQKLGLKCVSNITRVLSGLRKTVKGLSFSYYTEQTNIV